MEERGTGWYAGWIIIKIFFVLALIFLLILGGRKAYSFGYQVFADETVSRAPGKDVAITVEDKMSPGALGELLERKGLVEDEKVFAVQMRLSKYNDSVVEGSYILNTSQTAEEMLAILSREDEKETES